MNNYPSWWNTTLTIYNKYTDPQTDVIKWYKHKVNNCFWKYVGDKVKINNNILETNNIICRIPAQNDFLDKYEWINLANDTMSSYFTIGVGDIIIKGDVSDDIDEYLSGHRSTDVVAKYKELQGCMIVERMAINTDGGRCNEHYYVKGI